MHTHQERERKKWRRKRGGKRGRGEEGGEGEGQIEGQIDRVTDRRTHTHTRVTEIKSVRDSRRGFKGNRASTLQQQIGIAGAKGNATHFAQSLMT